MIRTTHRVEVGDARGIELPEGSVHLVVTSPPYPMIAMWDEAFAAMDPSLAPRIEAEPEAAFEAMHAQLDAVWRACARALVPGGFLCVNVGDAARSVGGRFRLFPNHARVLAGAIAAGLTPLPDILWRKPTNAPNKFMGSGMLPAGAYVTYEHEYLLVLRKGGPRAFSRDDAGRRRRSAYFWEERNAWFSDLWEGQRGRGQAWSVGRGRSAAFPLEIPWRLVHMYSLVGDLVLDPFAGTGTTLAAAAACGRSSLGLEVDPALAASAHLSLGDRIREAAPREAARLPAHRAFVAERVAAMKPPGHHNAPHDVPVVTRQEEALEVLSLGDVTGGGDGAPWEVCHEGPGGPAGGPFDRAAGG